MKKIILVLAAVFILFTLVSTDAQSQLSSNAKYQLFQGFYKIRGDDATIEEKGVFRINVETGQVWYFFYAIDKGKIYDHWVPIKEYNGSIITE